jgi:hypothetical protein
MACYVLYMHVEQKYWTLLMSVFFVVFKSVLTFVNSGLSMTATYNKLQSSLSYNTVNYLLILCELIITNHLHTELLSTDLLWDIQVRAQYVSIKHWALELFLWKDSCVKICQRYCMLVLNHHIINLCCDMNCSYVLMHNELWPPHLTN